MTLSIQAILDYIAAHPGARREDIRPATAYRLAGAAVVRAYLQTPYNRRKPMSYKKEFPDRYIPNKTFYLAETERQRLREAGTPTVLPLPAGTYARRILERLLIDLSWASSRMEGNTYNLLETERLIRFGQEASGKDRKEAVMIINHKEAIQYVVENLAAVTISRSDLFNIHALLSDGLIGLYELNNVSLLREVYVDAYLTSAENYRTLRAEIETPGKAALVYRDFVRRAVRRCVLEWKAIRPELIMAMAAEADIPEEDREEVVQYIGNEFGGLHEGNVIRYRLRPEDLMGLGRE